MLTSEARSVRSWSVLVRNKAGRWTVSVEDVVRELFKKQDQRGLPAKATERNQPETFWGRSFPSRGNGRAKALGCVDLVFPGTARGSVWPEGRGRRGEGRGIRAARRGRVRQAPGHRRGLAFTLSGGTGRGL